MHTQKKSRTTEKKEKKKVNNNIYSVNTSTSMALDFSTGSGGLNISSDTAFKTAKDGVKTTWSAFIIWPDHNVKSQPVDTARGPCQSMDFTAEFR